MKLSKREEIIYELGKVSAHIAHCKDANTYYVLQQKRKRLKEELRIIETPLYEVLNGEERK